MKPGKIDKTAVCHELDLAADKFDDMGFSDLAAKVDYYANRLRAADEKDMPKIYRALARIQADYKKREAEDDKSDNEKKAEHATQQARRASDRKHVVLARRLKKREAELKKAHQEIERLKDLLKIARKRAFGKKQEEQKVEKEASKEKKPASAENAEKRAEARRARIRARQKK